MYYYIYQIINLVNNKIYIGVHKTKDLDDGYVGSGKVIKAAIEKYGIDNFRKEILEFFENAELMYAKEKEIVTDDFLLREDTYNLRRGGNGGFDYINKSQIPKFLGKNHTEESKQKMGHPGNRYAVGNQNGKLNRGLKRNRLICPHCNKDIAVNVYARFHGYKCKDAGLV